MIIKGLDFTSAPSRNKPITCARCRLTGTGLQVEQLDHLTDFSGFEHLLAQPGEWLLGCDFPFAQSRTLVENLHWPDAWTRYAGLVAGLTKSEFADVLNAYKKDRAKGDKEHRRETDRLAGAISPQKLYGVPTGKMFYEGVTRLLQSPADILPLRMNGETRIIAEVYPALVARHFIGKRSYKNDTRRKQTPALTEARRAIVDGLASAGLSAQYGIQLEFNDRQADGWINDHSGDELDAVLGAVQAAWAWLHRHDNFGIPRSVDMLEGWICDPALQIEAGARG
jgi:hypothetical protein